MNCNKCGMVEANTTHLCPPPAGSFTTAWTVPMTASMTCCYRCGRPAIGHWQPIYSIAAAAPLNTGPFPLCSEHMAESFGYATKMELDAAKKRIADLEAQIAALVVPNVIGDEK